MSDTQKNTDPMEKWSVKKFRETSGDSGYDCEIHHEGKPVLVAVQHGRGGCNIYHVLPGAPDGILSKFKEEAAEWGRFHGAIELFEIEDQWTSYQHDGKILKMTPNQFLNWTPNQ